VPEQVIFSVIILLQFLQIFHCELRRNSLHQNLSRPSLCPSSFNLLLAPLIW